MLPSPPAALLAFSLLAAPSPGSEPSSLPSCEAGVRYIELVVDAAGKPPEVCIRPGVSTNLFSDSKWGRVELEGRESFRFVLEGENALTLVPSEALRDGTRLLLKVFFGDGAAPTSATFALVVHPFQAERQVEVSRRPRPVDSYRQEAQQARAEVQQCREERAHLQSECRGWVGLTGLIAHGLVDGGILSRDLRKDVTGRSGDILIPTKALSYRSTTRRQEGQRSVLRLAVELELLNGGSIPWKAAGAALVGPNGEVLRVLEVWQPEPISPGKWRPLVVEVEAMEGESHGPLTLKLWAEDGSGSVTLGGITFP